MTVPEDRRLELAWLAEQLVGPLADALADRVADNLRRRPPIERIAYSPDEAAEALGVGRDKVYELMASGQLPSVRLTGRRLIRVESLRQFLLEQEAATAEEGRAAS